MSGILDRLKSVEAVGSPGRPAGGEKAPVRSVEAENQADGRDVHAQTATNIASPTSSRTFGFPRVAVPIVLIFAVLIAWRIWKGGSGHRAISRRPTGPQPVRVTSSLDGQKLASVPQTQVVSEEARAAPESDPGAAQGDPPPVGVPPAGESSEGGAGAAESHPTGRSQPVSIESPHTEPSLESVRAPLKVGSDGNIGTPEEDSSPSASSVSIEAAEAAPRSRDLPTPEEDERTKSFLRALKISGVYSDAGGYAVLIDGREYQKGGKLGQVEIVQITSDRVTFGYKKKRYHLLIR